MTGSKDILFFDFETRSHADLRKVGLAKYVEDKTTEPYCCSVRFNGKSYLWVLDTLPPFQGTGVELISLSELVDMIKKAPVLSAHNFQFDYEIFKLICKDAPEVPNFIDTAFLGQMVTGTARSLDDVSTLLNTKFQKQTEVSELVRKYCKPRIKTNDFWERGDLTKKEKVLIDSDYNRLYEYCIYDTLTAEAIYEKCIAFLQKKGFPKKEFLKEIETGKLTFEMNQKGMPFNLNLIEKSKKEADKLKDSLNDELLKLDIDGLNSITQTEKIIEVVNKDFEKEGKPLINSLQAFIVDQRKDDHPILKLYSLGKSKGVAKFDKILDRHVDGSCKHEWLHYGANTGRWTSRGVQLHNLMKPKEGIDYDNIVKTEEIPKDLEALSAIPRYAIQPNGKKLYVADFRTIEYRVQCWLSGDTDALDLIKKGGDPYLKLAKEIFPEKKDLTKDSKERQIGKKAVLGMGYYGWTGSIKKACKDDKIEISDELAQLTVDKWSKQYKKLVDFRNSLWMNVRGKIKKGSKHITLKLPSGRQLFYVGTKMKLWTDPNTGDQSIQPHYTITRGGKPLPIRLRASKVINNYVQATARDIMRDAMLRFRKAGYDVLGTVHDEIIVLVPEDAKQEELDKIMLDKEETYATLPIEIESYISGYYKK